MPRGYLKHVAEGKKARRGGASRRQANQKSFFESRQEEKRKKKSRIEKEGSLWFGFQKDDYSLSGKRRNITGKNTREEDFRRRSSHREYDDDGNETISSCSIRNGTKATKKYPSVAECPICCEVRPLFFIMKKCASSHTPACRTCLREIYVSQAQRDVANFPLRCYHPSCSVKNTTSSVSSTSASASSSASASASASTHVRRSVVCGAQLERHCLFRSEEEVTKHYRLEVLAKAYSTTKNVAHCPHCDFPRTIFGSTHRPPPRRCVDRSRTTTCRQCKNRYELPNENGTTEASTIRAVENFARDCKGPNNGWAKCPRCGIIISKGFGCDHMICVCGHSFSWAHAQKRNRVPLEAAVLKTLV